MTVTLEFTKDQERLLEESTARRDARAVRRVLFQAVDATVPKLLQESAISPSPSEFRGLFDRLASDFVGTPGLSVEAVSRAAIFEDRR